MANEACNVYFLGSFKNTLFTVVLREMSPTADDVLQKRGEKNRRSLVKC